MAVVHQPSDQNSCHLLIIQDIYPSGEFEVCVQYHAFLFMYLREVIKQQLGSCTVVWYIPKLIQDQDGRTVHPFDKPTERTGRFLPGKLVDQGRGAEKPDWELLSAGFYANADGQHRPASSGAAIHDDVFPFLIECQFFQALQAGSRWETDLLGIKLAEFISLRKTGSIEHLCDTDFPAAGELIFQEMQQVFLAGLSLLGERGRSFRQHKAIPSLYSLIYGASLRETVVSKTTCFFVAKFTKKLNFKGNLQ